MYKHICVSVEGLEARLNASKPNSTHGFWKILTDEHGRFLTYAETRAEVEEWKKKGYEVFSGCDNMDKLGHCLGHEDKEENHESKED